MKADLTTTGRAPLSRETRDSFFLVGVVLLTLLPQLPRLPLWASGLVLAVLGWRTWLAALERPLPPRWLLVLLLLGAVGATKLTHGIVIGREPGLTLVCLLLAMKLLETHARRDSFVVFFLGFFIVLAQYLHSQALWVALWSLATVWGLLSCLVLSQMPLGQPSLKAAGREAARSTLLGLPIMVLLFLLFPRIAPLWGLPGQSGSTGLSDSLEFGQVADLAQDETIALRLRPLDGGVLPLSSGLYVRGPVLSQFDGRRWKAEPFSSPRAELQIDGPLLRYQALLEPQKLPLLPVLEMSPGQPGDSWSPRAGLDLVRSADLSWMARRAITERLVFEQSAALDPAAVRAGPLEWRPALRQLLQLPAGLNPRLLAWARAQAEGLPEAERGLRLRDRLFAHIRAQPFGYTLAPGVYGEDSPHAIDEFWFDRRLGFCEHYASAFVVAMRAGGVPARIVTGFLGADAETQDGWTLIRNSHAHAWAEFWVPGRGWLRADPTAAVAPERVDRGQLLQAAPGVLRGAMNAIDPTLWLRLRSLAESVDLRWQQWVLGYQRQQQFQLLEKLGFESPDWDSLGRAAAAAITLLVGLVWAWQRWQGRSRSPWPGRLNRVRSALARQALAAPAHQAPLRWAQPLPPGPLRDALLQLEHWRYGAPGTGTESGSTDLHGLRAWWAERRRWRAWWRQFQTAAQAHGRHQR